ncbi:MAG: hypothetical protein WDZ62_00595 [Candidatus Pacearchaeota archaeon]
MTEENHSKLVKEISDFFIEQGFNVLNEVSLPRGKGSIDIVAIKGEIQINGEVKTSPSSVLMKKVKRQLNNYSDYQRGDCVLFSPLSKDQIFAQRLGESLKNPLYEFVQEYLH